MDYYLEGKRILATYFDRPVMGLVTLSRSQVGGQFIHYLTIEHDLSLPFRSRDHKKGDTVIVDHEDVVLLLGEQA